MKSYRCTHHKIVGPAIKNRAGKEKQMVNNKLCPLKADLDNPSEGTYCLGAECAWYVEHEKACAVRQVAINLDAIYQCLAMAGRGA